MIVLDIYSFCNEINQKREVIIDNIHEESLAVYVFLVNVFSMSDVADNLVFQFVFRSYYQSDLLNRNTKFQQKYFQTMQDYRYKNNDQLEELFTKLNEATDEKQSFSLTTELLNMIQPTYPIYHCYSDYVFPFFKGTLEKKQGFNFYIVQYYKMIDWYKQIKSQNLLQHTIDLFDEKFDIYDLPHSKKLDFIFTTYGKLVKKNKITIS